MTRAQATLYYRAAQWAEMNNRTPGQLHAYLAGIDLSIELTPEDSGLCTVADVLASVFDLSPVKRQQACRELMRAALPHLDKPE